MPKALNRKALAQIRYGQKFPTFLDLKFRHEVVKASGSSTSLLSGLKNENIRL
jgi:hypothetical protein